MKILQLSSEKSWRGGEQQIAYLTEEMLRNGTEVMVACREGSAFEDFCKRTGILYKTLPFRNSADIFSALQLKKLCLTWKPDIIHVHSSKSFGIAWLADLFGNRIPLVLSRRVVFPVRKNKINILKYNLPRLRRIICISYAVRQQVLHLIGRKENAIVIHDGIDSASFSEHNESTFFKTRHNLADNSILIGTTAAFTKEKDYPTFLRAAAEVLKEPFGLPVIFLAIGEGPEKPAMQELCQQLGLQKEVIFTGFIPEVKNLLHELDIFLFTSTSEGMGSSILDAYINKTAVVATAAGGIPEIVQHEETGLLAPVGDSHQLAAEVLRLLQNPELRGKLGENAFERVKQFDKKITAAKTIEVYHQVIKEN